MNRLGRRRRLTVEEEGVGDEINATNQISMQLTFRRPDNQPLHFKKRPPSRLHQQIQVLVVDIPVHFAIATPEMQRDRQRRSLAP